MAHGSEPVARRRRGCVDQVTKAQLQELHRRPVPDGRLGERYSALRRVETGLAGGSASPAVPFFASSGGGWYWGEG